MCHDPATAERFYVALPDKHEAFEARQLRLKALKRAVDNPTQDGDNMEEEESVFSQTPESSSTDEQPVLDDEPDSSPSVSSDEMRMWKKKQSTRPLREDNPESDDELPSFQKSQYKKRLVFTNQPHQSEEDPQDERENVTLTQLEIYSPSKCFVRVDKLRDPIADFYLEKRKAKQMLDPRRERSKGAAFAEPQTVPTPAVEPTARSTPVLTSHSAPDCIPAPSPVMTAKIMALKPFHTPASCIKVVPGQTTAVPIPRPRSGMASMFLPAPSASMVAGCVPVSPVEMAARRKPASPPETPGGCDTAPS